MFDGLYDAEKAYHAGAIVAIVAALRIKKTGASEGTSAPVRGADASFLDAPKRSLSIGRDHFLSLVTRGRRIKRQTELSGRWVPEPTGSTTWRSRHSYFIR